ncbi:MAG: response regulator [Lachnospiraceae bacterium]|nr:response regulator [Lachnospiraceae bacterium]
MSKDIGKEKILIVDDVETNRIILEEIIKDMGEEPILAESGEQALELVRKWNPQLVLTDISMPGMDGYELCRILKGSKKTKNIPIVFISAFDDPKDIMEGFSLGGEDYITKPFIPKVVQARVGVQLRLHEAKRELMEMNRRLQISVSEQLKQMEQEKKNILYAMANIAAQNLDYEKAHMDRMGKNCRILAQGMQLSPMFEERISDTYIDTIELAAPLCDIGNIGISKEILQKGTKLAAEEAAIVQNHTNIGAKLLKDIHVNSDYNDFISTSIDIAQYHHENWDGSGYPDGMAGEEIPLAAQIVSLMERYCTLTGKEACSREEALEIMKGEAGVRFNPDIFKICCKISRQLC